MTDEADKSLRDMAAEQAEFIEEPKPAADDMATRAGASPRRSLPWPLFIAIAALLVAVVLAAWGYRIKQEMDGLHQKMRVGIDANLASLQQADQRIVELRETLQQQNQLLQEQQLRADQVVANLETERANYQQGRSETLQALNDLQRRMGRSTSRWMAAEAEYLIRIANHRLQLEADSRTALNALQAADERLRDTADPLWTPVRELLAEDIARLKALAPPDYAGLSARLAGLSRQVEQLPVKSALLNQPVRQTGSPDEPPLDWQKVLADGWQGFRSLVVVRRHDQPVAAMLPPEQRFFLGQNLRLQLESARLALLRRDQALFDDAIDTALDWLNQYFEAEAAATRALRDDLEQLRGIAVRLALPDLSGALVVLRQQMEESYLQGQESQP